VRGEGGLAKTAHTIPTTASSPPPPPPPLLILLWTTTTTTTTTDPPLVTNKTRKNPELTNYFSNGSLPSSSSPCSILDSNHRDDLTIEEAKELGLRAIRHATYRDPFSGGYINIFLIRNTGWERLARIDAGYLDLYPSTNEGSSSSSSGGGDGGGGGGKGGEGPSGKSGDQGGGEMEVEVEEWEEVVEGEEGEEGEWEEVEEIEWVEVEGEENEEDDEIPK